MHLGGYCRPYFRGLQRGVTTMDHDAHRHAGRTNCSRQAKNDSDSPYVECSKKADVMDDEAMMVLRHSKHMRGLCVYSGIFIRPCGLCGSYPENENGEAPKEVNTTLSV